MATRVLLLSDTHGRVDPRIARLAVHADICVHAGDIGNASVFSSLAGCGRIIAVRGNNDTAPAWPEADRPVLQTLPREASVELPGGRLTVIHGDQVNPAARRHESLRRRYPDSRLIVYGHSHRLVVDQEEEPWVVNPGAAGRTRTYGGPSCVIIEADAARWSVQVTRFTRP